MADTFKFELVSPERLLVSAEAVAVVLPGSEGEMTVMAKHAPLMSTLRPGVITVELADGQKQSFIVFGGFADILPDGCTVLAEAGYDRAAFDGAELARRIEAARAEREQASGDDQAFKLDEYLSQLTTLQGSVPPA
ncbi:F0F1 ATP synthase subunit epsilon [Georhizobium profundi]|uniref:ATP synthase epsilon chain n=1 Tax=Georhizobium profundi TaxID=2341112 RepID=A0A3Q8XLN3_9HYPH|nr:F0F1 ATP synthase subunit epsilon [Georhizobium profundi]AZN70449.1 F0F1 ATP synthase subunit epsilon [Georhizobium profundi]